MSKEIIRHDHVGSFLRSKRIKKAREDFKNGSIEESALRRIENEEIEKLVQKQVEVGVKAITDGEYRRAMWHLDFFLGLNGIKQITLDEGFEFSDGIKTPAISFGVVEKIEFNESHPFIEHFKYLNRLVEKYGDGSQVAKITIPAPSVIMYRHITEEESEVYVDKRELFKDLAVAYKKMVDALYDAGCRYIQFDDTTLTTFVDPGFSSMMVATTGLELRAILDTIVDVTNHALADRPNDLYATVHMCRGNFKSHHMHADGGYDYVSQVFDRLPYDAYFLEYDDHRSGTFEPLANMKDAQKFAVLGVFTSKTGELEDEAEIVSRIEEASEYIDKNRIILSPQCGFASSEHGNVLTEEQQWNKMKHIINLSEKIWQ